METNSNNPEGDRLALAAEILTALRRIADVLDIDLDLSRPQRLLREHLSASAPSGDPDWLRCVQPDSPEAEPGVEVLAYLLDQDGPVTAREVARALNFRPRGAAVGWLFWLQDLGLVRHDYGVTLRWEPLPHVQMERDCAELLGVVA